jgi:hypothetical protein
MVQAQQRDCLMPTSEIKHPTSKKEETCKKLKYAINKKDLGGIVATHQTLITQYYQDVQAQANQSFCMAKKAANYGFGVLIGTLVYALFFDGLSHFKTLPFNIQLEKPATSLTVAGIGLVSGVLIEFISGIAFWLYLRGARQFSAFHICLERTHRYLIAYMVAAQMEDRKDETLHELVCIMAKAQMMTRDDIDSAGSGIDTTKSTQANHSQSHGNITGIHKQSF